MLHPFNSSGGMGRRTCPSRSSSGAAGGAHLKKGIFSPRRIDRERKIRYNRLCFPSRPARYAHLAQGIEHSPPKRRVGRSNRLAGAMSEQALYRLLRLFSSARARPSRRSPFGRLCGAPISFKRQSFPRRGPYFSGVVQKACTIFLLSVRLKPGAAAVIIKLVIVNGVRL